MTRNSVRRALQRVHSVQLANTTVEVFEPAESYKQGDGYTVTYPDLPSAAIEARVEEPSTNADQDRSGTSSEIDAEVRVRSDLDQQWTGWGESGAATRLRDAADGRLFEVQSVVDGHNGLLKLEVVEV